MMMIMNHQPSTINHQSSSSISLADTKNVTIISKKSFLFGSRSTVTAACNAGNRRDGWDDAKVRRAWMYRAA